ncbi:MULTISPECIES: AAA family ATPase [Desulfococcus]|uniref:NadR/Ttd14 AAA domain-containing protein n=1 Tax=Desulfococcus multivorans DSM 2059 TaxID=1121405 RepID=S7TQU9_DESML|nr:ATP-binding protein [Desulfococcus multivorans]AOY57952.1 conserved uncharacterized protein [Desulfococcus multivorans]AQV00322.1 hypothetical protein B2D07_05735 [Desulfococcus multivorans]EPR39035.1 hypothetical protein dsmv_0445 [Desulfococcus multivorans DSM 2059]SJZ64624.1 Predicted ATPase [Desulfococcus multivorans DSM 2059]
MRKTHWCVITGAPCSGKTTVILSLERQGYRVVHEAARKAVEEGIAAGMSLREIRESPLDFQRRILQAKLTLERKLPTRATIFIDRGIPDSIAYFQFFGLDPEEPLAHARHVRYRRIFFFERLPWIRDGIRNENPETVARLDTLLQSAYQTLGYPIIRVPVLPAAARTDYVLNHL